MMNDNSREAQFTDLNFPFYEGRMVRYTDEDGVPYLGVIYNFYSDNLTCDIFLFDKEVWLKGALACFREKVEFSGSSKNNTWKFAGPQR